MEKMTEKLRRIISGTEDKNPLKSKEDLKLTLKKIISKEQKKRISNKDTALISECVDMLLIIDRIDPSTFEEKGSEIARKVLAMASEGKNNRRNKRIYHRKVITAAAIMGLILTFSITALTIGSRIIDMGKLILNFPEKEAIEYNGNDIIYSSDIRTYDTIEEMIESEKVDIVYPRELPDDYTFEEVKVIDYGNYLDIIINSNKNHIKILITTNTTVKITEYAEEINGIQYNIINRDGIYQAYWILNENYYMLSCGDKEDLLYAISKVK